MNGAAMMATGMALWGMSGHELETAAWAKDKPYQHNPTLKEVKKKRKATKARKAAKQARRRNRR